MSQSVSRTRCTGAHHDDDDVCVERPYDLDHHRRRRIASPSFRVRSDENTAAFIAVLIIQSIKYSPAEQCANETGKIADSHNSRVFILLCETN